MIYVPRKGRKAAIPWTEALVKRVLHLYQIGKTIATISQRTGIGGYRIHLVLRKNGVKMSLPGHHRTPPPHAGKKKCSSCHKVKEQTAFSHNMRAPSGLNPRCRACVRETQLLAKFQLTQQAFNQMLISQKHVCAICGKAETARRNGRKLSLSVDHCHASGKIRGLLCSRCNKILGQAEESIKVLEAMISYLKEHA
jgi:hypothetical protein